MGISSTIFGSVAKPILTKATNITWENRDNINLYLKTKYGKFKNLDIRFSISGLYKIQIPNTNKQLLVLNRRIENQLQPVGGVYKRYGDDSLFNKWGYKEDNFRNGLNMDNVSSSDLRFMVKGKYVIDVLKWFNNGQERENEPRREFMEELVDTDILNSKYFTSFNQKHIRRYSKNLSWSEHFSCYEILIYDVYELIPNENQIQELIALAEEEMDLSKGFAIVSCDDIEQLRLMKDNKQIARISEHSKLLINQYF